MPENIRSTLDPQPPVTAPDASPFCFVTEDGVTVTITLDPAQANANPTEALVKAKDAVRCLAEAFARAERRIATRPDEVGAVFRSWAYLP